MPKPLVKSVLVAAVGTTAVLSGVPAATASPAETAPSARIVARFDLAAGQTAENAVVEPDGTADVSFAVANQVAQVSRDGTVSVLAQLPAGGRCAIFPGAAALGLARAHDGTVYVVECSSDSHTGVWAIRKGAEPVQIAQLAPAGLPNGMAVDERTGDLYVADSFLGEVWKVPTRGGAPSLWAAGPQLAKVSFGGANGLAVHNGAVWVGNTDQGLIVRIPIQDGDGSAGPIQTVATGLDGVDDFAVVGPDNTIIAALNFSSQVVLIKHGQQPRVLLTAADGLSNPTAVRVRNDTLYVTSAAYFTGNDPNHGPNLLVDDLDGIDR
jgi:sugar lactone lactonase YvrE